eukprot:5518198-Heterocapsa_arctica.AAC.1
MIKILNDDDAMDLFAKALTSASASLVQIESKGVVMNAKVLAIIKAAVDSSLGIDLIVLALSDKRSAWPR